MAKKIVHQGRAANCVCKKMKGARCPDCNHLLTDKPYMTGGGEAGRMEDEVIKCGVCGRTVNSADYSDAVLEVHDIDASQKGVL